VDVIKERLDAKYQPRVWTEHGEPTNLEEASRLAKDPYEFQWWAVRMVGGQPPKGERKKGADGGVDGEISVRHAATNTVRRVIVSVKGGETLTPEPVKSLDTTVRHEKADYGILVTMYEPSSGMRDTASDCGRVPWASRDEGKMAQRIRIVTVAEILAGTFQLPGKNETPRTQSSPPPPEARAGETLNLPFAHRTPSKAKPRKPGPAKTYDEPRPTVRRVGETIRPPKR
jgi:hypothetical protein